MDCIFCKIVDKDMPSYVVYEDDDFLAILDRFPASLGHVVIITKEHARDFFELPEETAAKLLPVAQKIAKALKEAFDCDGLNVLQNNEEVAGQSVFHYHLHLIPRYKDDTVTFTWKQDDPSETAFNERLEAIQKHLKDA